MGFCTALFSHSAPSGGFAFPHSFWEAVPACCCSGAFPCGAQIRVPGPQRVSLCPLFPSKMRGEPRNLPFLSHPFSATSGQVPAPRATTREVSLNKPMACPAALSARQKGSNYRRTAQRARGRHRGLCRGGTRSIKDSASSTRQFIKRSRPLFTVGRAEVKVLHLADLCDLGLQVPRVPPQTVLELLSVTINIGVMGARGKLALPKLLWQCPITQGRIWAEKTSLGKVTGTQSWEEQRSWRHHFSAAPKAQPGRAAPAREVFVLGIYLHRIFSCSVPELSRLAQPRSLWLANAATYSGSAAANSSRGWPRAAPGLEHPLERVSRCRGLKAK